MSPRVSVVLVSDYGGGPEAEAEICEVAALLARQNTDEPAEVILVHHSDSPRFHEVCPGLRVLVSHSESSYRRKNEGVRAAAGDWIALLDGDCLPSTGWLRALMAAATAEPNFAAFSGPTFYAGAELSSRVLSLLARGYLDPGSDGVTRYVANNNCLMRRDVYLSCPLPEQAGAFAAHMQSEALHKQGFRFKFVAAAPVTHAFEGWEMERDLRRNTGYISIHGRRIDPSLPYASLLTLGWFALPFFAVGKFVHRLGDLLRCRRRYGIAWSEMPSAVALAARVQTMEIPGMVRALRGQPLGHSMWR